MYADMGELLGVCICLDIWHTAVIVQYVQWSSLDRPVDPW